MIGWFLCVCVLSPERSPREILMDLDSTHNIFKDKIPKVKEEMEEKLQVSYMGKMGVGLL